MSTFVFLVGLAGFVLLAVLIATRLLGYLREPEDDIEEKKLFCWQCHGIRSHYKKQYRADEISFGRVKFELTGGTMREGWFCYTCGRWTRDVHGSKNFDA